ncbi:MAG: GNAT family N-acetyltransferase [Candidatus Heimdallarchaeota archaeon]|nr:GNAT family N-acetyltransferase [Candidatus Heimdallarchaeota archaeon]
MSINWLKNKYWEDPSGILPHAWWKTAVDGEIIKLEYLQDKFQLLIPSKYYISHGLISWINEISNETILTPELNKGIFGHNQYQSYFKMTIRNYENVENNKYDSIEFINVDVDYEVDKIAEILNTCYPGSNHTVESIQPWMKSPAFTNDGWKWLLYKDEIAGLGIADLYQGELSLEWIQILPQYQGKGLGTELVTNFLQYFKNQCDFATVSGRLDNQSAYQLYRKSGFIDSKIWLVSINRLDL